MRRINVTIYNEFHHERHMPQIAAVYPKGIHSAIVEGLAGDDLGDIVCATLDDHVEVLTQECLANTDVLIWWGHGKHEQVDDGVVDRICARVNEGMGFLPLHSAHASKPMMRLLGTHSNLLRWRESGERCRIWIVAQNHPIAEGLDANFVVPQEEMYGEAFGIPEPDELIFLSWFEGGDVFRSGCVWKRGAGKIFYFQNGHETYPVYYQAEVRRVINNAVRWVCPPRRSCVLYPEGHHFPVMLEGPRAGSAE